MTASVRPAGDEREPEREVLETASGDEAVEPATGGPEGGSRPADSGSDAGRVVALDGLRGLSLAIIVLYHVRLGPFTGGLSAVTVFFTLSGFLIASRTVAEVDRTGRFRFGRFVERRIRRLVPASLVCLLGTLAATHLLGDAVQRSRIGGDTVAALLHVANWRFLFEERSYAQLFAGASPLTHYWTLAIEEQFYLLFPLVAAGVMALRPQLRGRAVAASLGAAVAASLVLAATAGSFDRFYYATDTRLFELLAGVVLGVWTASRSASGRSQVAARVPDRVLDVIGLASLAGLIWAGIVFKSGAMSFVRGGAQLTAVLTVLCIVVLQRPGLVPTRLCSWGPLVWLGRRSYAIYLLHWPIVALTDGGVGPIDGGLLAVAQIALSLSLAELSWHWVERPVMERAVFPARRRLVSAWLGAGSLLGVAALFAGTLPIPVGESYTGGDPTTFGPVETVPTPVGADPVRIAVAGDSTAVVIGNALARYQVDHPDEIAVLPLGQVACTVTIVARSRHYRGESGGDMTSCNHWPETIPREIAEFRPDVSIVVIGMMEQAQQQLEGSDEWHDLMEPEWRERQMRDFARLAEAMGSTGAPVWWSDVPYMEFQEPLPWISHAPERTDVLNGMFRRLASEQPGVRLLDYAEQIDPQDGSIDLSRRPDGVHLTDAAADELIAEWLVPMALAAGERR